MESLKSFVLFRYRNSAVDFLLKQEQVGIYNPSSRCGRTHQPVVCVQTQDHNMEEAGQRLRRARERLNLKFRDVEQPSQLIADRRGNAEFVVLIMRLSDIDNQRTLPTLYRLLH